MPIDFIEEMETLDFQPEPESLDFRPEPESPLQAEMAAAGVNLGVTGPTARLPQASPDDLLQGAMVSGATHQLFNQQAQAEMDEQQRLAEEDEIWREAWGSVIREPTLRERIRTHPITQKLVGPPPAEQEARQELGQSRGTSPGQIVSGALAFTTPPPPLRNLSRALTEQYMIPLLPGETAKGIYRGIRETLLGFPLAAPSGKVALGAFATEWAWHLPEQREAFHRAVNEGDKSTAAEIATQNILTGALFAAGAGGKSANEFAMGLRDNLKTSVPGIRPESVDVIARTLLDPRTYQREALAPERPAAAAPTVPEPTAPRAVEPPPTVTPAVEPEIVGMGGAIPSEFAPVRTTATGIKNAVVDRERQSRGLEPILSQQRVANEVTWDRAMAKIDNDPAWQDRLVAEFRSNPRTPSAEEIVALDHRYVDLQNEYAKATRDGAQAYSDGRTEGVAEASQRAQFFENKLTELEEVARNVGSEWGRSGQMRQRLMKEDFTLAAMEAQERARHDFRPLTETERAEVAATHEKLQRLQTEFDALTRRTEEAQARQRSEQVMTDLRREATQDPQYSPQVLKLADKIVSTLNTRADAARVRLREKLARTSAGVDPTILADVVEIMAAHLAEKTVDFARVSARLIEDFGEKVRPYVQPAWDAAQKNFERTVRNVAGGRADAVVRQIRSEDPTQQRTSLINNIAEAAREERPLDEIGAYVRNLSLRLVKDGIRELDPLVDTIHNILKNNFDPEITRRQTLDAITGYGDWKPLDKDAAKMILRDLKGQGQQVAKLEDIEARKPLLKTGVERRTPSDKERRLIQQVNEAKRKYGVVVTDPATQLKSAQDAILTRLRHQIADLNVQIENQARTVKTKTAVTTTPEMDALRTERDRLRTQLDELVPKPGISDAQRSQIAERALEADIQLYEQRIKSGDIRPIRGKQQGPPTERMDQLRTRRDELKAQLEDLRAAQTPTLTPEQRALKTLKSRMLTDLSKTQDRINRGDFEPRKRKEPPPLDAEAARIKGELDRTKTEWRQRSVEEARKRMTKLEKAWDLTKEATHAQRQFWTAFDLSAPGRQGAILMGSHPQLGIKAGGSMFRALSEKQADAEWVQIQARPNAQNGIYQRAKLYLSNPHDTTLSKLEENVRSRWLRNVPGIKQSNQAYVTFLNRLRADAFDLLKGNLERSGTSLTLPELQGIANYINVATGRGDFGRLAGTAEGAALVLFSPRLVLSRFQYVLGQPIYKAGSGRVRRLILKEYARSAIVFATLLSLGMLGGATVETDSNSADFLKLKTGNVRRDIGGGLLQAIVALSRQFTGERKKASGQVEELSTKFGKQSEFDEAVRFLRSKLSPTVSTYVDFRTGENMVGEKVNMDIATIGAYLASPLAWRDVVKLMEEEGIPAGTADQILSLFGVGVQHYKPRQ